MMASLTPSIVEPEGVAASLLMSTSALSGAVSSGE
jgi:hypothetical protein